MGVIILAGLSNEAKSLIERSEAVRHDTQITYGCFPPFENGLPLFEYHLPDGEILIEHINAFGGDFGTTVFFKELCGVDGILVSHSSWDMDDIAHMANND